MYLVFIALYHTPIFDQSQKYSCVIWTLVKNKGDSGDAKPDCGFREKQKRAGSGLEL